jgi:predicted Zn finger-like uncharacterized protein
MIINCEKCTSKFNLDDSLIKETGSKVRCSVCKGIFTVFPQKQEEDNNETEHEETVDLDSSLGFEEESLSNEAGRQTTDDFDRVFENALNEEQDITEEEKTETETLPASVKRKMARPGLILIILIIAFVAILGALSVYLFAPALLPERADKKIKTESVTEAKDEGNIRLEIVDLKWETYTGERFGQLFIIKGKVINNYPQPRSHILVKGTVEDDKRNPITQKLAYAGNTFTENELKEITLEEIDRRLNIKEGINNANVNVAPMEAVPFMIIFVNLPESMSEYVVETVSSDPGE